MATTRLQIGPADHGRHMTLDEFREAEEEPGYRYELARGVLDVVEIPGDAHGQVVDNVHEALSAYRGAHPGLILRIGHGSDTRVVVPALGSDRHPDLAVVFRDPPLDDRGRQRPGLAVEVVSPGKPARQRDYQTKRDEYLTAGLDESWVVDPDEQRVTVFVRREGPDGPAWDKRVYEGTEVIQSVRLPGFDGTVAELWVDVEPDEGEAG